MFKKVCALLLIAGLALASPVWAATPNRIRATGGIETSSTAATLGLSGETWVYGVTIYADASSSYVALFDATTYVTDSTAASAKIEIGEATQYDTQAIWFDTPMLFSTGVSVWMSTGVAHIYYGPPPQ